MTLFQSEVLSIRVLSDITVVNSLDLLAFGWLAVTVVTLFPVRDPIHTCIVEHYSDAGNTFSMRVCELLSRTDSLLKHLCMHMGEIRS